MKDKQYKIYDGSQLRAYGLASKWQVIDWRKMGYTVIPYIGKLC